MERCQGVPDARQEHVCGSISSSSSSGSVPSAAPISGGFSASSLAPRLCDARIPRALVRILPVPVKKQQAEEEMTLSNLTSASAGEASVSSGNRTDGTNPGMPPTSSTPATPTTTTVTVSSGQPLAVAGKRKRNLPGTPGALRFCLLLRVLLLQPRSYDARDVPVKPTSSWVRFGDVRD